MREKCDHSEPSPATHKRIYVFALLCMSFVSICAQNNDTILVSHHVPSQLVISGYNEEEWFFKSGEEISAFSCIITSKGDEICSIRILQSNDVKRSFINESDMLNTSLFNETSESHAYFYITYSQQIKALEEILIRLSTRNTFSEHLTFIMMLEDAGEQTLAINSSYKKNLSQINEDSEAELKHVIKESQLFHDVSNVFNIARLQVVGIETEKIYGIPKDEFLKTNIIRSTCKVPNRIISTTIYFKIRNLQTRIVRDSKGIDGD